MKKEKGENHAGHYRASNFLLSPFSFLIVSRKVAKIRKETPNS